MPRTVSSGDRDALEALIDRTSLAAVLDALSVVCTEKAAHLEANWQDSAAAGGWVKAAAKLRRLAESPAVSVP